MLRLWIVVVLAIGLVTVLAACGQPSSVDAGRESGSAEPSPCPAGQTRLQVDRRAHPDERAIASELGVPVGEVQRHSALSEHAGRLAVALNRNERETYGSLEIVDEQDLGIVVYFTEDGEETVRPYVRCTPLAGFVEIRTVEASIAELEAAQDEAYRIVTEELGIRADSGINIQKNRVEVYVNDEGRLEKAMSEAGVEMPKHVAVVEAGLARPS